MVIKAKTILNQRLLEYTIKKPYHSSHTKWTTTEDSVNDSAQNCLAKTTIEKLTAFRYQFSQPRPDDSVTMRAQNTVIYRHPEANFAAESSFAPEDFADEVEIPTSYQPFDWAFDGRNGTHQSAILSQTPVVQPYDPQSDSPEYFSDSQSHLQWISAHGNDSSIDIEIAATNSPVTTLDANAEFHPIQDVEMASADNLHLPTKWEFTHSGFHQTEYCSSENYDKRIGTPPDESHSIMENAVNTTGGAPQKNAPQGCGLVCDQVSLQSIDAMMESASSFSDEQRTELAAQIKQMDVTVILNDDEFPFDEGDEAELAELPKLCHSHQTSSSHPDTLLPPDQNPNIAEFCDISRARQCITSNDGFCAPEYATEINLHFGPQDRQRTRSCKCHHESSLATREKGMIGHSEEGEYTLMMPFARPDFPFRVRDRSPISGFSANLILRTCFRIGEAIRASITGANSGQDVIIELFARVTGSFRQSGTSKQYFQFADLFNNRPPFPKGVLENYKIFALQETESSRLLGGRSSGEMVRCIGRLKRDIRENEWMLYLANIRSTDWEEVRWTKMIAGAGIVTSVRENVVPKPQQCGGPGL